jgi:hypothetical protein
LSCWASIGVSQNQKFWLPVPLSDEKKFLPLIDGMAVFCHVTTQNSSYNRRLYTSHTPEDATDAQAQHFIANNDLLLPTLKAFAQFTC